MDFRFYLINERTGEKIEIDEPVGFDGFKPVLRRDKKAHGITFEFAEQELGFYDNACGMVVEEYEQHGVDASLRFLVECNCGGAWQEFYSGMLDYARYSVKDGESFFANVGIAQLSTLMTFRNRMETKVWLNDNKTLDGQTVTAYTNLGKEILIPSKAVIATNRAMLKEDTSWQDSVRTLRYVLLPFGDIVNREIPQFESESRFTDMRDTPLTPQTHGSFAIFRNMPNSLYGTDFHMSFKLLINGYGGGVIEEGWAGCNESGYVYIYAYIEIRDENGNFVQGTRHGRELTPDTTIGLQPDIIEFDGNVVIQKNHSIIAYAVISIPNMCGSIVERSISLCAYEGSFFKLRTKSLFEPTNSKVFMIHETLSRITESITDNALTVKSDYFGRRDSEVNPAETDGTASLRCFTNGFMLRDAKFENTEDPDPKFTVSFKDVFDGLIAIDAIGLGIEDDKFLRIEPWEYFYKNDVILVCDEVAEVTRKINPNACFALANIGYAKWEAEEWNGIDGFHGRRQYRTRLKNVDTKFEQFSKFVADSYAVEATRRRGIFDPSKDWRYDNDIFIFDLERGIGGNGFNVKTGDGDGNTLVDPATVFNVELSPVRNAARWFSFIMQGVRPEDGDELIFAGAEGYAGARTESKKGAPIIHGMFVEDSNISLANIARPATPIFKPETVEFEYPLTFAEFAAIKANPYGLVRFNGEYGWIKEIEADIVEGMAKFTLIPARYRV